MLSNTKEKSLKFRRECVDQGVAVDDESKGGRAQLRVPAHGRGLNPFLPFPVGQHRWPLLLLLVVVVLTARLKNKGRQN